MSEKVLGIQKDGNTELKIKIYAPNAKLVPVVSLQALKEHINPVIEIVEKKNANISTKEFVIWCKDLLSWAENQGGEKKK